MQRFDQRVISSLTDAEDSGKSKSRVHLLRDDALDVPSALGGSVIGFASNRSKFVRESLSRSRTTDVLLVGQINLLPLAWIAKKLNPRLRVLLFVHGVEVWNEPIYRRKRFYEPLLLGCVDRIASVSRYTATVMEEHFRVPSSKFLIFPNAVDGPISVPSQPRSENLLLSVTRMASHDRSKNLDLTIRAFATVLASVADARLEIVGDGVLRPELEALARSEGISDRVHFCGRVSDDELAACYRRAKAFVLPSSKEGFGIVYLEAWKYGLPVICGAEGAPREIISDGYDGFVSTPNTLSSHMGVLLSDTVRAGIMGSRGALKVSERYLDKHFRLNLDALLSAVI